MGRSYGNQLILGDFVNVKIDRPHSSLSCSETKYTIVMRMHALIVPLIVLDRVKNCENRLSSFRVKVE